jgi:DNA-binding transcriptional MocR family regulator
MLPITVDARGEVPVFRQIYSQIMAHVDEGRLRPGDRLPSTRILGPDLGVHRSTVIRAYEELRALGYLESRPGSYTTVRERVRPAAGARGAPDERVSLIDWSASAAPGIGSLQGAARSSPVLPGVVDFERLSADPRLAPAEELRRCVRSVLVRGRAKALDYTDASGSLELRELLAKRMVRHGVDSSADEIVVTAGAQHALDLLLRLLTVPGDTVIVEAPTYALFLGLLRLHRLNAVEVPMRSDGMDLEHLERVLQEGESGRGARLVYTMPSFQNPTGITTDQQHRERLLLLCEQYRVPVIEDGFEEEMKYTGKGVLPVKSMDSRGVVLYVGTFSKVVFPGLRVGWIAAPPAAAAALRGILQVSSYSGNSLAQAAAARFCAGGGFEAYLRRIHRIYRRRMQTLLDALEETMPSGVSWTRPRGGYTVWLTCPPGVREDALGQAVAEAGVRVSFGRQYFERSPARAHVRLSIACIEEEEIRRGCRQLGAVLASSLPTPAGP